MKKIKTGKNYDIILTFKTYDDNGKAANKAVIVDNVCGTDAANIVSKDSNMNGTDMSFPLILAFAISFCEDVFDCRTSATSIKMSFYEHNKYPFGRYTHVDSKEIATWAADDSFTSRWMMEMSDDEYKDAVDDGYTGEKAVCHAVLLAEYFGDEVDMRVA